MAVDIRKERARKQPWMRKTGSGDMVKRNKCCCLTTKWLVLVVSGLVFVTVLVAAVVYIVAFTDLLSKKTRQGSDNSSNTTTETSATHVQNTTLPMETTTASTAEPTTTQAVTTELHQHPSHCARRGCCYAAYMGPRAMSASGAPCVAWQQLLVYSSLHIVLTANLFPDPSWSEAGNKCRNPNDLDTGPWCFILAGEQLAIETCALTPCANLTFDACEPNPCANGGTCTVEEGGATCTCPEGYGDTYCMSRCSEPILVDWNYTTVFDTHYTLGGYPCLNHSLSLDASANEYPKQTNCFRWNGCLTTPLCYRFLNGESIPNFCPTCNIQQETTECQTEGIPYWGNISSAASGRPCMPWEYIFSVDSDRRFYTDIGVFAEEDYEQLAAKCRNPTKDPGGPWCFVLTDDHTYVREYCSIPECQEPLDYCSSNPCLHGGTCFNIADRFRCHCRRGYIGRRCETSPDDCVTDTRTYAGHVSVTNMGRPCVRWENLALVIEDFLTLDDFPDETWEDLGNYCRYLNSDTAYCVAFNDVGGMDYFACVVQLCSEFRCDRRLLFEDEDLSEIRTSSVLDSTTDASRSPLGTQVDGNLKGGWVAAESDENQWIEIWLVPLMILEAILTQGRRDADQWITQFSLSYKADETDPWRSVYDSSNNHIFMANRDPNSVQENRFWTPVVSRIIRLLPVTWHQGIALRWEILACDTLVGKTAYQSDHLSIALPASLGIDGNVDQLMESGSCISTTRGAERWWSVDLGERSTVYSLIVFPRHSTDGCESCLRNFNIWVTEDNENPFLSFNKKLCLFRHFPIPARADGEGYWLTCREAVEGRYVIIHEQGINEAVTFCEVLIRYKEVVPVRECWGFRVPYMGSRAETESGHYCQFWSSINQDLPHDLTLDLFVEDTWDAVQNKCRDPFHKLQPMCAGFVSDFSYYVAYCEVPYCPDTADFDYCEPNPCEHAATCVPARYENARGYTCLCRPGYYGILCQSEDCLLAEEAATGQYTGNLAHTVMGLPCVLWSSAALSLNFTWEQLALPDTDWGTLANKCRYIEEEFTSCYTYLNGELLGLPCILPSCPVAGDCLESVYGYTGAVDVTASGKACVPWIQVYNSGGYFIFQDNDGFFSMHIQGHHIIADMSEADLRVLGNKCRNPNEDPLGPWCFAHEVVLVEAYLFIITPQYCNVPAC